MVFRNQKKGIDNSHFLIPIYSYSMDPADVILMISVKQLISQHMKL